MKSGPLLKRLNTMVKDNPGDGSYVILLLQRCIGPYVRIEQLLSMEQVTHSYKEVH